MIPSLSELGADSRLNTARHEAEKHVDAQCGAAGSADVGNRRHCAELPEALWRSGLLGVYYSTRVSQTNSRPLRLIKIVTVLLSEMNYSRHPFEVKLRLPPVEFRSKCFDYLLQALHKQI